MSGTGKFGVGKVRSGTRRGPSSGWPWARYKGVPVNENNESEDHLNRSLDDVIALLEREIRRLGESLETYRLSEHPKRAEIIRWHVRALDERQDALQRLRAMLLADEPEPDAPRH